MAMCDTYRTLEDNAKRRLGEVQKILVEPREMMRRAIRSAAVLSYESRCWKCMSEREDGAELRMTPVERLHSLSRSIA